MQGPFTVFNEADEAATLRKVRVRVRVRVTLTLTLTLTLALTLALTLTLTLSLSLSLSLTLTLTLTLTKFCAHLCELRPTIVVTYNGDGFDWPYIDDRC